MFAALSFILCFVWQYWAGFWARYAPASILANPTEDDHHEDSSGQDTLGEYAQREEDLAAGDEHERDGRPLNRYPEALEDDLSSRTFRYRFGIQYRRISTIGITNHATSQTAGLPLSDEYPCTKKFATRILYAIATPIAWETDRWCRKIRRAINSGDDQRVAMARRSIKRIFDEFDEIWRNAGTDHIDRGLGLAALVGYMFRYNLCTIRDVLDTVNVLMDPVPAMSPGQVLALDTILRHVDDIECSDHQILVYLEETCAKIKDEPLNAFSAMRQRNDIGPDVHVLCELCWLLLANSLSHLDDWRDRYREWLRTQSEMNALD